MALTENQARELDRATPGVAAEATPGTRIRELEIDSDTHADEIGSLASLNTTAKNNLVAAINELKGQIGTLSALETAPGARANLVAAINNVIDGFIGALGDLETVDKSNLVAAIDEVKLTTLPGGQTLADLHTTTKVSILAAINELADRVTALE